jgi:hypothetical protein
MTEKSLLQLLDEEFGLGLPAGAEERREIERRACVAPVVLVPGDDAGILDEEGRRDGIALDVSEGGMRVLSRNLVEAEFLEVRIPKADGGAIVVRGQVVRTRALASGYREYGIRRIV